MNIMLIGIDFYPRQTPSDKNFWLSIVNEVKNKFQKIQIISFVKKKSDTHIEVYDNIVFNYFKFLSFPSPYSLIGGFIARLIAFCLNIINIKRIIKQNGIEVVHFVDNFGIVMPLMKLLYRNVRITASLAAARPKDRMYDLLLRISYSYLDRIATFTECLKERLIAMGIDKDKIDVIRWAVKIIAKEGRNDHYQNKDKKVVLWTGFLTQVREEDFFLAMRIAKRLIMTTDKCKFIFCFKSHFFNTKYKKYESEGIEVQPNNISFNQIVNYSDIYFCPIKDQNKIIGPPLTWIEMMLHGKPIITTAVNGAKEIVKNRENGYICKDEGALIDSLLNLVVDSRCCEKMGQYAREFIKDSFNFEVSCQKYLKLWGAIHE